jgi:hypothetical protein
MGHCTAGGHAAARRASDPASRSRDVWLGGGTTGEDSFPLMEVPHLDPGTAEDSTARTASRGVSLVDDLYGSAGALALVLRESFECARAGVQHGFRHPGLRQLQAAHIAHDDVLIRVDGRRGAEFAWRAAALDYIDGPARRDSSNGRRQPGFTLAPQKQSFDVVPGSFDNMFDDEPHLQRLILDPVTGSPVRDERGGY